MAIRYRKLQNKREGSKTFGKWYGRAVMLDTISTKELAREISHSTTVTYSDVVAVLTEMGVVMKNHLQNSHRVVLDGIGAFKVGLRTAPAETSGEFTGNNIKGYRINYQPEVRFNATGVNEKGNRTGFYIKDFLEGVVAREVPKNAVVDKKRVQPVDPPVGG